MIILIVCKIQFLVTNLCNKLNNNKLHFLNFSKRIEFKQVNVTSKKSNIHL
jgi:hypothetical protein